MSIKNYFAFHEQEQIKLLKKLADIEDEGTAYDREACAEANARTAADDVEDASDMG